MSDENKNDPSSKNEGSYEVGYGKPPKQHRFTKGNSGNKAGRPKGRKFEELLVLKLLDAPITMVENGKRKKVTKETALLSRLVNGAINGKSSDMKNLLDYMKMVKAAEARARQIAQNAAPTKMIIEYVQGPSPPKPIVRT